MKFYAAVFPAEIGKRVQCSQECPGPCDDVQITDAELAEFVALCFSLGAVGFIRVDGLRPTA